MEFVGRSKVSMVVVAAEKIPIGSSKLVSSVETFQALLQIAIGEFCGERCGRRGWKKKKDRAGSSRGVKKKI